MGWNAGVDYVQGHSGWYRPKPATGLVLDGHASGNITTGTTASLTLTTTQGSGTIIVCAMTVAASFTGVPTATGLTFVSRGSVTSAGGVFLQAFEAPYSSNFSGTISITSASSGELDMRAFGVANSSGFDTGGPQTASTFGTNASITTAHAADFVYFQAANGSGGVGGSWTNVDGTALGANNQCVGYQIVSATGTYTTAISGGTILGAIIDAVKGIP